MPVLAPGLAPIISDFHCGSQMPVSIHPAAILDLGSRASPPKAILTPTKEQLPPLRESGRQPRNRPGRGRSSRRPVAARQRQRRRSHHAPLTAVNIAEGLPTVKLEIEVDLPEEILAQFRYELGKLCERKSCCVSQRGQTGTGRGREVVGTSADRVFGPLARARRWFLVRAR